MGLLTAAPTAHPVIHDAIDNADDTARIQRGNSRDNMRAYKE